MSFSMQKKYKHLFSRGGQHLQYFTVKIQSSKFAKYISFTNSIAATYMRLRYRRTRLDRPESGMVLICIWIADGKKGFFLSGRLLFYLHNMKFSQQFIAVARYCMQFVVTAGKGVKRVTDYL
jgi:hypothetical protein